MRSGLEIQPCEPLPYSWTIPEAMEMGKTTQGVGNPLPTLVDFMPKSLLPLTATPREQGELIFYLHEGFVRQLVLSVKLFSFSHSLRPCFRTKRVKKDSVNTDFQRTSYKGKNVVCIKNKNEVGVLG